MSSRLIGKIISLGQSFNFLKRLRISYQTYGMCAYSYRWDLLIRDIWQYRMDSVHDMHVVNTYTKTQALKTPEKCLQEAERGKKWMYLEACLQQRRHFSPFVASVYGMLVVEATATLKMLASRLATIGCAGTSRVWLQSLLCVPHTAAYGDPGCWCTGSVYIYPSGKTALG